jgi:hypothetical protein
MAHSCAIMFTLSIRLLKIFIIEVNGVNVRDGGRFIVLHFV